MAKTCIIIGASHAAAQLIPTLRQEGWEGDIILIGDEPHLPYHRPPLSKTFLAGEADVASLAIRSPEFYTKNSVQFIHGTVTSINRSTQSITLANDDVLKYDKLAICTGARVRTINLPGSTLAGVCYLRNIADVETIKPHVGAGKNVVIIGGGYIGLEAAAMLTKLGMHVVVLESAPRILQRVTAPQVSEFYTRVHREEGVNIQTNTSIAAIQGDKYVEKVLCADGTEYKADLVIVGIGVLPNSELAASAGLTVENGIVVDEYCRTSDPNIVAAGDVANQLNQRYSNRIRIESVPNAGDQAKSAAAALCGNLREAKGLPWFWSDQFDMKLQIAGLNFGYDHIAIRGDIHAGRSFAAFYFKNNQLIAADCVNRPQEFMLSKKVIGAGLTIDADTLADDVISVKELLALA